MPPSPVGAGAAPKPEAPKPEAPKPEAPKPEAAQSDADSASAEAEQVVSEPKAEMPLSIHPPVPGQLLPEDDDASGENLPTRLALEASVEVRATEESKGKLTGSARQLMELCQQQLKGNPERRRAARLYYEIARIAESHLGELRVAAKNYESAVRLAPDHAPSVRGLRRTQLRLKQFQQALASYDLEVKLAPDDQQSAMLLFEKACVLDSRLAQRGEARDALELAAKTAPAHRTITKAAISAQEVALAWPKLADALHRAAAAVAGHQPPQQAAFLAQMARVVAVRLKEPGRAIELYKAAIAADSDAPGATAALRALLRQESRWSELVEVLRLEAELVKEPSLAALAKFQMGRLYVEQLGAPVEGLAALEEAAALTPADRTVLAELARTYEQVGRFDGQVSALERLLGLEREPTAEQFFELGVLYDERLRADDYAVDRYTRALGADPAFRPALLNLRRIHARRGRWQELIGVLSQQAGACVDNWERAELHGEVADIYLRRLASVPQALVSHRSALEADPGYARSYQALVRLLSEGAKWHDLIELYERRLELELPKPERISTLLKIGRLEEDALNLPAAAADTYRRLLETEPEHPEGIDALQRAAARGERFDLLVEALQLEARSCNDVRRRRALLLRAAEAVDEELNDSARALAMLSDVLVEFPDFQPAVRAMIRIHHREESWEELVEAYGRELKLVSGGSGQAAILLKMGELAERRLKRDDEALKHFRAGLQAEPKNLALQVRLQAVLTRNEDFQEVVELLERQRVQAEDGQEKARLAFLEGEIREQRLDAQEQALQCYRDALELSPGHAAALQGVERILEAKRDHKKLQVHLAQVAEGEADSGRRAELLYRQAELLRDQLKQPSSAAEVMEQVLELTPKHPGALFALERLYVQLEEPRKLARLYERQAKQLDGVESKVAAYQSWVQLLETTGDGGAQALKQGYQAVLELSPNDPSTLFALERLALDLEDESLLAQVDSRLGVAALDRHSVSAYQTRIAERLEARGEDSALEVYRAALSHDGENLAAARGVSRVAECKGQPDLLIEAAETERLLVECPQRAAHLLVMAASQLARAGDDAGASEHYSQALELDPDSAEAAAALTAIHGKSGKSGFLLNAMSRAAGAASSPEKRAEIWLDVARLHAERTKDNGAAIAAALRAVREQPGDVKARHQLAQYYSTAKSWKECVAQLQELLKRNPPRELQLRALIQLAAVQTDYLEKPAPAEAHAKAALELAPDDREALKVMLRIQLARKQVDRAAATASHLAKVSTSAEERAEALHQSARLERHRGNAAQAHQAYVDAVAILGAASEAAQEYHQWLEGMQEQAADWGTYASALQKYLSGQGRDNEGRHAALVALGRLSADRLGDVGGGLKYLTEALAFLPGDEALQAEIAHRLKRSGKPEDAVPHYLTLARKQPTDGALWRSVAGCYESLLQMDMVRLCLAPLVAGGQASAEELDKYHSIGSRRGHLKAGSLGADVRTFCYGQDAANRAVAELVATVQPALVKLYPLSLERYGLSRGDRLTARSNNAIRELAVGVASLFGVEDFDIYVHRQKPAGVRLHLSEPPTIVVGPEVSAWTEDEQAFALARCFAAIASGTAPAEALSWPELRELLAAVVGINAPATLGTVPDAAKLAAAAKRVQKAMPWFSGGKLEAAAQAVAAAGVAFEPWRAQAIAGNGRMALLASDELAGGIKLLEADGCSKAQVEEVLLFGFQDDVQPLRQRLLS